MTIIHHDPHFFQSTWPGGPAGPGPTRLVGPVARKMGAQLNSLEYLKLLFPEKYSVLEFLSQFCGISFK